MDYVIPGVIEGAGAYLREKGLRIDARWSVRADWMPDQPGWDGVVAHLINMEGAKRKMEALGLPEVHLSGWLGSDAAVRVEGDFAIYGKLVVDEFQRLGLHRAVGFKPGGSSLALDFEHWVRIASEQAGLDFVRLPGWRNDLPWDDALKALVDETETVKRPFGLFMPHAGMAFSLIDEFAGRGLRIPEDVAIIVIDKDAQRTAELAPIPLTAVVPDFWRQGYEAARLVHRMIGGEWLGNHVAYVAPLGLVRRASTGEVTSRDPVVAKVLHLIRENPLDHTGVDQLARMAGTSRRTLEMRFLKETGSTLHRAITARKIEEAKRLLRIANHSLAEVTQICGFSSVYYFSTAFKRETGETPGGYRAKRAH